MTVLRWVAGTLIAFSGIAYLLAQALGTGFDAPVWLGRARRLRHVAWLAFLLWFNVEVWVLVVGGLVSG